MNQALIWLVSMESGCIASPIINTRNSQTIVQCYQMRHRKQAMLTSARFFVFSGLALGAGSVSVCETLTDSMSFATSSCFRFAMVAFLHAEAGAGAAPSNARVSEGRCC